MQVCEVTTDVMRTLCSTFCIVNCVHNASDAEADVETSWITNVLYIMKFVQLDIRIMNQPMPKTFWEPLMKYRNHGNAKKSINHSHKTVYRVLRDLVQRVCQSALNYYSIICFAVQAYYVISFTSLRPVGWAVLRRFLRIP